MKRMKKNSSLSAKLAVLVALFAVLAIVVFAQQADQNNDFDRSLIYSPETQLAVYVDGSWSGALSDSYAFGDTATVTAPAVSGTGSFSHWEADGSVISYSRTLKLTMNAHTTLYAVYAQTAPTAQPTAGFTSIARTNDGNHISFQAIAAAADGEALTGAGIVYSTSAAEDALLIGGAGVTNAPAVKLTDSTATLPDSVLDENNCWMLQIPADSSTVYYARAYVTTDAGTVYGDVKTVKLSELESGVSLIANLEGFDPESGLTALLAGLTDGMCTVTFDGNGGAGAEMTQAFVPGTPVTLRANTYTNGDYDFLGWNTAADGSGAAYADEATVTLDADITLYAMWKRDAVVITEPTAKELTFNGSAQELVSAGEAEGGTMYYAVTTTDAAPADDQYTATIPTAENPGTYYVWYKVVGDSTHNDTAPVSLTSKIVADMTALQAIIEEAIDYYNSIKETYPTIAETLNTAISEAQAVTNGSQSVVNAAVTALNDAINAAKAAKQLADDTVAANAVEEKIDAIGTVEFTDESKAKITAAREAYEALTAAQKELVANFAILTAAEEAYASLQAAADVDALIAAIGTVDFTDESKAKITAAREAYEALTAAQKALVSNVDTLIAAEERYSVLSHIADHAAADVVVRLIDAIGEVQYSNASLKKIESARDAYEMLTDAQKSLVGNYDKLTNAEETYEALKNRANSKEERLFSFFSALAEFLQYLFKTVLPQLFKMGR